MFVRVEVILPQQNRVLAIPATAVLSAPFGDSVFIVIEPHQCRRHQSGRAAEIHPHRPRARRFCERGIGLKAGDRVVTRAFSNCATASA
jgi:membrane fusion protein, multidrug efflux system